MRIAIVSDIHGNRTAFEAVLADLRQTSPDLILHGDREIESLSSCGLPHADWLANILMSARPQMPKGIRPV